MAANTNEFGLEFYRQAWQATRHTETMRAHFGVFYGAITGGLLGLIVRTDVSDRPVYLFLAILSLFGLFLSLRFAARGRAWTRVQKDIARAEGALLPGMDPDNVAPPEGRWEELGNWFRPDRIYPTLFAILMVVFIVLSWKPDILVSVGSP